MKKLVQLFILSAVMLVVNTACSSDDDGYQSKLPMFSDISANTEIIYTNQSVQFTAVQSRKGQLLYNADYKWYLDSESNCVSSTSATYDKKPDNPVCTMTAPSTPGRMTVIFKGEYKFSGKAGNGEQSGNVGNMTVKEEFYPLKGIVTLKKTFIVYQQP